MIWELLGFPWFELYQHIREGQKQPYMLKSTASSPNVVQMLCRCGKRFPSHCKEQQQRYSEVPQETPV